MSTKSNYQSSQGMRKLLALILYSWLWKTNKAVSILANFLKFFWKRCPLSRQGRPTGIKKNGLGIFRARGGGLLDHSYAPCHPPSAPPVGERQGVNSQTAGIRWVVMINIFYFSIVVWNFVLTPYTLVLKSWIYIWTILLGLLPYSFVMAVNVLCIVSLLEVCFLHFNFTSWSFPALQARYIFLCRIIQKLT